MVCFVSYMIGGLCLGTIYSVKQLFILSSLMVPGITPSAIWFWSTGCRVKSVGEGYCSLTVLHYEATKIQDNVNRLFFAASIPMMKKAAEIVVNITGSNPFFSPVDRRMCGQSPFM